MKKSNIVSLVAVFALTVSSAFAGPAKGFKFSTGISANPDGKVSGLEAAKKAKEGLGDKAAKLVLIFSGRKQLNQGMIDSVATVFEKKIIFGCEGYSPLTKQTNFHDQNVQANGVAILAVAGDINISIASAHTVQDGGYEKAGIKIGSELKAALNSDDSGKFLVTFGDQHVGGPSAGLVKGLRQELGKTFPIVGAAAGQGNAKEIVAGEIVDNTNVGVLISGEFMLGVATSGYKEDLPTTTKYAISSALSQSKGKPVMAFLFDCGGRRGKMFGQKQLKAEFDTMKSSLGDTPFFGFYGGGEIGPVDQNSPSKGVGFSVATAIISVVDGAVDLGAERTRLYIIAMNKMKKDALLVRLIAQEKELGKKSIEAEKSGDTKMAKIFRAAKQAKHMEKRYYLRLYNPAFNAACQAFNDNDKNYWGKKSSN